MTASIGKVLVTGATGFIGSHVARRLVEEKIETAIVKRGTSDTGRIRDLLSEVAVYDVDLRDTAGVMRAMADFRPRAVLHVAASYAVEHALEDVSRLVGTNSLGTINLLEAAREQGVRLFVNTSTCFVYGAGQHPLAENAALSPLNLYALTKLHAEQACGHYAGKYGMKAVTLRLFPPYGPGDQERRLIPYLVRSFLAGHSPKMTTGRQKWDFIYAGDIAGAYMKTLSMPEQERPHEIINIGSGRAVSVREVADKIRELTGAEAEPEWGAVPHRGNEVWYTCADVSRAGETLGWRPETDILEEGLALTVDWYRKQNGGEG